MPTSVDVTERMNEGRALRAAYWRLLERDRTAEAIQKYLKQESGYSYRLFGVHVYSEKSELALCLDDGYDATFVVSILERGCLHAISVHETVHAALNDFFTRMNGDAYPAGVVFMKD